MGDAALAQPAGHAAAARLGVKPSRLDRIDLAFAALADPTRRAVVRALVRRPHRAGELAQALGTSAPALSRHLRQLRVAGLVQDLAIAEDARVRLYQLAPKALEPLRRWLDEAETMWGEQLRSFKAFAEGKVRRRS